MRDCIQSFDGEQETEPSAATVALESNGVAAMGAGETAGDGEAEAGSARGSGRTAGELYKQRLDILFREAWAAVEDREFETSVNEGSSQDDFCAGRRVHGGIYEKIRKSLLDEGLIEPDHGQIWRDLTRDAMAGEHITSKFKRSGAEFGYVAPIQPGPDCAGLEARHVQEVVNDPIESGQGGSKLDESSGAIRRIALKAVGHSLESREGSFQLMRYGVEQGLAKPFRLGDEACLVFLITEALAIEHDSDLREEGIEQVALGRGKGRVFAKTEA